MKKALLLSGGMFLAVAANAQSVGIGTNTPDPSSVLDVTSSQAGVLVPRMSTAQMNAIVAPATGLLIYNSTDNKFYYFDGAQWVAMVAASGSGSAGGDPTLVYTVDGF